MKRNNPETVTNESMKTLKQLGDELGIKKHTLYRRLNRLKKFNPDTEFTIRRGNTDYLTESGIELLKQDLKENPVNVDNTNRTGVNDTINASGNDKETKQSDSNVNCNDTHCNYNNNTRYTNDDINELLTLRHENELLRIQLQAKESEVESLKREMKRLEESIDDVKQSRDAMFKIFGNAFNANSRLTNESQKQENNKEIEPEEIEVVINKKASGTKNKKKKRKKKKKSSKK